MGKIIDKLSGEPMIYVTNVKIGLKINMETP